MNREKMIKLINEKFPQLEAVPSEEFDYSNPGGIWFRKSEVATLEDTAVGDIPIFIGNSFDLDPQETTWTLGVHNSLRQLLSENGWYAEPYDSGTWFAWRS